MCVCVCVCVCVVCVCVCVCPIFTMCCPFFTIVLFGSLCKHICLRKQKQQKTLRRTKETYLGLSNDESCHDANTVAGDGAPSPIRKANLSDCQDFLCQDSSSLEPPGQHHSPRRRCSACQGPSTAATQQQKAANAQSLLRCTKPDCWMKQCTVQDQEDCCFVFVFCFLKMEPVHGDKVTFFNYYYFYFF